MRPIMIGINLALSQIKQDEGCKLILYQDPRGYSTIGWGCNLSAGISQAEADFLLNNRVQIAVNNAQELVSNFDSLSDNRQAVLIGMAYNLGHATLEDFHQFIAFIEAGQFDQAADDLLTTAAAKELPARYNRYAEEIRKG
jgi:lysozyme